MNTFQDNGKSMDLPKDLDNAMVQVQLRTVKEMGQLGVRNIHSWKLQFDDQLDTYKKDYEGMKCTERGELDKQLKGIENQIERVKEKMFI